MQGKEPPYIKLQRRVLYPVDRLEEYMRQNFKEYGVSPEPGEQLIEREQIGA